VKLPLSFLLITSIELIATLSFGQDTLSVATDSVDVSRNVIITPDGSRRSLRSLPFYVQPIIGPGVHETSMGMSVLNTLRGQVPGLLLTPQFVTGNPLGYSSMLVVDGAPSNADIALISSLNTFDYELPTVITGNAGAYYGVYGTNGGVLLTSKTGEGFDNGRFTFNTFNTDGTYHTNFGRQDVVVGIFRTSNSLAYSKDFGAVDVRASYNFTATPSYNDPGQSAYLGHNEKANNLKVNAGWKISSRLRTRLILEKAIDDFRTVDKSLSNSGMKSRDSYTSWRANFTLDYNITSWLRFSAKAQSSSIDRRQQQYYFYTPSFYSHDRSLANAFMSFNREIASKLWLSASTGVQKDEGQGTYDYDLKSQINILSVRYNDNIFIDGSFRTDNNKHSWMGGAGWVFTDLLGNGRSILNYGKLRGGIARFEDATLQYYPQIEVYPVSYGRYPYQLVNIQPRLLNVELGTDLQFLQNRLQLTFNYLKSIGHNPNPVTEHFDNGNIIVFTHVDRTYFILDQQQVSLGFYATPSRNAFTKLLLTTYQARTRTPSDDAKKLNGQPFYIDLLHTESAHGFTVTLLAEAIASGGKKIDAAGIRQFSIGHEILKKVSIFSKRPVPPPMLSLVIRNLVDSEKKKVSSDVNPGMYTSISLGLTANF
jgi:hypothetical protein